MLRRVVGALFVLVLCVGFTVADEIRAIIKKVSGDKVTFAENKGKGEQGPEKTMSTTANVKVVKGKFDQATKKLEPGDAIEGGLKNKMFSEIGEKGLGATVITEGDKISEIRVGGGGKKKQ